MQAASHIALICLAACSAPAGDTPAEGTPAKAETLGTSFLDPSQRERGPVLQGRDLSGKTISPESFAGQIVVVNLWASWCAPCRKEAPVLRDAAKRFNKAGVTFVGILHDDRPSAGLAFGQQQKIPYVTLRNGNGAIEQDFQEALRSAALPTAWVLDREGRVASRITTDSLSVKDLEQMIAAAES
jgi:thiol-disulfide isomerase/thioredoxin